MPLVTDFTAHKTLNLHLPVELLHLVFWNSWMNLCSPMKLHWCWTGCSGSHLDRVRCKTSGSSCVCCWCGGAQSRMTAETVNNSVWDWKACLLGLVSWCRRISPGLWKAYSLQDVSDLSSWDGHQGVHHQARLQLPSGVRPELQVGKGKL